MSVFAMTESKDEANLPMCKEIAEYLCQAYPGHSWHVRIDGGLLIIKNMAISQTASMIRKFKDIAQDAGQRKRDVVMAAGAFLEAAHMHRGKFDGEPAKVLEGLPKGEKFKPIVPVHAENEKKIIH